MILVTFAVASALAGIAGVLVGINYNAISPFMGIDMTTKGMAVMLIGGLGSIYGAMAGGLLLGMVEVISVAYLASSYRDAFAFCLMILVLLVRPRGLFSDRRRRRALGHAGRLLGIGRDLPRHQRAHGAERLRAAGGRTDLARPGRLHGDRRLCERDS